MILRNLRGVGAVLFAVGSWFLAYHFVLLAHEAPKNSLMEIFFGMSAAGASVGVLGCLLLGVMEWFS